MRDPLEHSEQCAVVNWCREHGVLCFAVPNGSNVKPHERAKMMREGLLPGVSDLVVVDKQVLFLEMKQRKKGALSKQQCAFEKIVGDMGYKYYCAKGAKDAISWLSSMLCSF